MMRATTIGLIGMMLATGCGRTADRPPETAADSALGAGPSQGITDRDWELVTLGDRSAPPGAGVKPVTLRLDPATGRAAGFAGCNRYSATYQVSGDSLSFGPALSTKMACDQGMDVETSWLGTIASIQRFQTTDSTLTLLGAAGPVAGFRAAR